MIKLKRAYEPAKKDDGFRVLVDWLWPRGVSKKGCPDRPLAQGDRAERRTAKMVRP